MKILNEIQQALKANKSQKNTFGNYSYRSCEDILEAVKPLLGDATLTITDEIVCMGSPLAGTETHKMKNGDVNTITLSVDVGTRFYVKATAILKCGEDSESVTAYAREPHSKKGMDSAQITGATSSYARKYALNGLFCIDDAKDADSTNKHDKEEKKEKPKAVKDPWKMVAEKGEFSVDLLRNTMATVSVRTDKQLIAYGSDNAIKRVKGE